MKLETVKLENLCTKITKGTTPSNIGEGFSQTGINYIRSEMLTQNKYIDKRGLLYISSNVHEKLKRSQLESRDILFSMAGVYLGKTAILRDEDIPANTNQAVALIRLNSDLCYHDFIYYYLNQPSVVKYVNQVSGQSAQPNINLQQIGSIPINLPNLDVQHRIADILSAYDDLIENNYKQIKLLEEAVKMVYKEWFVNLRFPGYENASIVDGLPEGWRRGVLSDVASFRRGKTITKDKTERGIIPVVAGGIEPAYYHSKANTVSPLITISASGANAGFTRMYYENVWASDCSVLDSSETENLYFIYAFLNNSKQQIKNLQRGAAQPHVYAKDINDLEIMIPTEELIKDYCAIVTAYFNKIACLQKIIKKCSDAKNKLLPKLMNGVIEV